MTQELELPAVRIALNKSVRNVRRFAVRSPFAAAWGVVAILLVLMAIAAPIIAPKDPIKSNFTKMQAPPDRSSLFGTDNIGRDILSRVIHGSRVSLFVALTSVLLGTSLGAVWGIASGYTGGKVDLIAERILEIIMATPGLILAFLLVLVLGSTVWTIILAIAVTRLPFGARVIRSVALSVREMTYVEAARAIGASPLRTMVQHVAPQCIAPFIVLVTVHLGTAIVIEASLSFLGIGIRPPTATWGGMLGEASNQLVPNWWFVFFPGVFITIAVMSFNLVGDGLRDILDPRLRGTT
ncbi:MAG: ABC transporter permease [Chloroflexi bacterium]|nr:ABC transporter permease [Chloroflexota bacterium]MDA1228132.1 ABC transporter permease [Chloroflexota bacterium]